MADELEANLYSALKAFVESKGKKLANSSLDDLVIPLVDGESIRVPVIFLEFAGQ